MTGPRPPHTWRFGRVRGSERDPAHTPCPDGTFVSSNDAARTSNTELDLTVDTT